MSLEIRAHTHQGAYLAGQSQTVYALLDMQPSGVGGRLPLDLRLVLDHSGSMSCQAHKRGRDSKLDLLIEAVAGMIALLEKGDRLMLVAFDDQASCLYDGVIRGPQDLAKAEKALRRLVCGGGTDMPRGLELALADAPLPDAVCRVVVVTDGETCGQETCQAMAFDQRGASTWLVYGIGVSYDDRFLDGLAQANGGQFVHLGDLAAATAAFEKEVEVMGEVALTHLVVNLEPAPGVAIVKADRIVPQLLPVNVATPDFLSVDLGDVDRARGQKLLVQFSVPALAPGSHAIATVRAGYHVPVRKLLNQTAEAPVMITVTADAGAIAPDGDVTRTVQLAGANRLTTLAMAEAASGDAAKGAFTLASAAALYQSLGRDDMSTRLKTLSSALTTPGGLSGEAEDVKRTLTTMARQAWEEPDA